MKRENAINTQKVRVRQASPRVKLLSGSTTMDFRSPDVPGPNPSLA